MVTKVKKIWSDYQVIFPCFEKLLIFNHAPCCRSIDNDKINVIESAIWGRLDMIIDVSKVV